MRKKVLKAMILLAIIAQVVIGVMIYNFVMMLNML